jgi:hypothetical protein
LWAQPADALKGNCLFLTFKTEKPAALLSLSCMNRERIKINKWKELKNK